jgi:beta-N-acetylhexosaminidase
MALGPVMVDLQSTCMTDEDCQMLANPRVGGVILFSRNFESIEQLQNLVEAIHQIRSPRLIVAVDQEGGRVQRFREGFVDLPPLSLLGELYDESPDRALECAQATGWIMAAELRAIGIDISFSPILDLDYGVSTVIGDRAFHRQPETVAELAHAYIVGMRKAGMAATGKHFPGHGAVQADSHTDLPVDERPYVDMLNEDLLSFERLIHYDIAAIMMAHVIYSDVDTNPACFSQHWIADVLRTRLAFEGVVFSDDLSMAAAHCMGSYSDRAMAALQAGCDMVLVCNSIEGRKEILSNLSDYHNPVSHCRLIRMHGKPAPDWDKLHTSQEWDAALKLLSSYHRDPLLPMDI